MQPTTCPTPRGFSLIAGGRHPRPCRRLACPYCGPRIALSTVKAIELAKPHGSAVITLPPGMTPDGDRARLRAFARILGQVAIDLRAAGISWEYVYTAELSEHLKPNLHVLHHGDAVSSLRFRSALARAGGQGDVQPIRHIKILARYIMKLPLSGLDIPDVDSSAAMSLHLSLNNGKLLHASRRFWRDGDQQLSGVRAARLAARSQTTGPAPTQEQLKAWRSGWALPPMSRASVATTGAPSDAHPPPPEGEGLGDQGGALGANFRTPPI